MQRTTCAAASQLSSTPFTVAVGSDVGITVDVEERARVGVDESVGVGADVGVVVVVNVAVAV